MDNCEISGFSHAGVDLITAEGYHIHHNHIHQCQYQGLGYGVCHNTASSLIEYNLFDWNRRTGRPGNSYVARQTPVVIRGVPEQKCEVHQNWFTRHNEAEQAVRPSGKTEVFNNACTDKPKAAN